jgi:hypothetical protein
MLEGDRYFSADVVTLDGQNVKRYLKGLKNSDVFKRLKQQADVKSVGRIAEVGPGEFYRHVPRPQQPAVTGSPRVVIHARPLGTSRPFAGLQPPPHRQRLRDVMPKEFTGGEYDGTAAHAVRDAVVETIYRRTDGPTWQPWPGRHKNVHLWVRLKDGRLVGFNEASSGWSFPVIGTKAHAKPGVSATRG